MRFTNAVTGWIGGHKNTAVIGTLLVVLAVAISASGNNRVGLTGWVVLTVAYWLPTIVAWMRHVPNAGSVTVIDGFLGWTVIGWIVALAMACRSRQAR